MNDVPQVHILFLFFSIFRQKECVFSKLRFFFRSLGTYDSKHNIKMMKKMNDELPPNKRIKRDFVLNENTIICPILADEFTKSIRTELVCVGTIVNPKLTSEIVQQLTTSLPLDNLSHLKRVKHSQIILCQACNLTKYLQNEMEIEKFKNFCECETNAEVQISTNFVDDIRQTNLSDCNQKLLQLTLLMFLLEKCVNESTARNLCSQIEIIPVPECAPSLRWQFNEANALWPCKFHPNKYLETVYSGKLFADTEQTFHKRMIYLCKYLCEELSENSAGIAVDPRSGNIVAIGFDQTKKHPLMHCPMVLIDAVARTQNGGAYKDDYNETIDVNEECANDVQTKDICYTMNGVGDRIKMLINEKFDFIKFGAECVRNKSIDSISFTTNDDQKCDNLTKYGPYLCTGYNIYLSHEPCTMCSMAFIHSRIKRLFFNEQNTVLGAVSSIVKLHTIKALNHHYEVFQIK